MNRLRIACTILTLALFASTRLSAQSETTYDVEFSTICLVDSIAPDTINQIWLLTHANNPGEFRRYFTFDFSSSYTPAGTLISCSDYYLGDNVEGSGTAGTVPIWATSSTLGNSALTQSATEMSMGTLTGALELPTGTAAQAPVWANGKLRYNTTSGGFQGGPSGLFLPWADAPSYTSGSVMFHNGVNITQDNSGLFFDAANNILRINNTSGQNEKLQVNGNLRVRNAAGTGTGIIYLDNLSTSKHWISAGGGITLSAGDASTTRVNFNYGSTTHGRFSMNGTITSAAFEANNFAGFTSGVTTVRGYQSDGGTQTGNSLVIRGARAPTTNDPAGDVFIRGGFVNNIFSLGYSGVPGYVKIQAYADSNQTVVSPLYDAIYVPYIPEGVGKASVSIAGGHEPTSNLDVDGKVRIRNIPDSLYTYEVRADANGRLSRQVGSYIGAISTSTDASGDIVVAHGMGTTPTSVQVTVTGTTPYVVTVHTIGGTNFTVRFFDTSGAAVASTAVTATWHAKT